jgi:hypothetical protein
VLAVVFGLHGANLKDVGEPQDWPGEPSDFIVAERGRPYLEASNRKASRIRGLGLQQIAGVVGGAAALETFSGAVQSPITSILAVLWLVASTAWSLRIYKRKWFKAQVEECWGDRLAFSLRTKDVPWTSQQRDAESKIPTAPTYCCERAALETTSQSRSKRLILERVRGPTAV